MSEPDDQRIAEIRAREQATTRGPWREDTSTDGAEVIRDASGNLIVEPGWWNGSAHTTIPTAADRMFIAHAREDIPFLLADLAEARAGIAARLATYDSLCRFFFAVTEDMSESGEVDTYDLWESAEKAGLAEQVPYDEEKHGDMESVDDGDSVWQLTALGNRATGRANDLAREVTLAAPQEREGAGETR